VDTLYGCRSYQKKYGIKLRAREKITSHFKAPMHPFWLRWESLKYLDHPALSRLARQAPQHLKM
jgi:hypothetical protein